MKALFAVLLGLVLMGCAGSGGKTIQSEDGKFEIEADDLGYYSGGQAISGIRAQKGQALEITFKVRETNVYYEGLAFKGCGVTSADTLPGESVKFAFTASQNCQIISVWPENGAPKKGLDVVVG